MERLVCSALVAGALLGATACQGTGESTSADAPEESEDRDESTDIGPSRAGRVGAELGEGRPAGLSKLDSTSGKGPWTWASGAPDDAGPTSSGEPGADGSDGGSGGAGGAAPGCVPEDDLAPCTADVCDLDGSTRHAPRPMGVPCTEPGSGVCDGTGHCVECLSPLDCAYPQLCTTTGHCVLPGCWNGDQDGHETGIDCGGPDCLPCPDLDECAAGLHECDPNASCTNVPGSYVCTCYAGFTGDGQKCQDIDECSSNAMCPDGTVCKNLPGSHTCEPISCPDSLALCGSSCVDILWDSRTCGSCDTSCDPEKWCLQGSCAGRGTIEVSVTWDRDGNGDLLVGTPGGFTISRANMGPDKHTELGHMDLQDSHRRGPEHIYWDADMDPPKGDYHVCFDAAIFDPVPSPLDPVRFMVVVNTTVQPQQTFYGSHDAVVSSALCIPGAPGYVTSFSYP